MKVSIGSRIMEGPWGGGNQFARSLSEFLKKKGWDVVSDLTDDDIDIILMTEPRTTSASGAYNQRSISRYLVSHPGTPVAHRINECDERKGTRGVNKYLMRANTIADHTVFISNFLEDLFKKKGFFTNRTSSVIRNGADRAVFNRAGIKKWNESVPLKLVTHHWGSDLNKGFDIYNMLDSIEEIDGVKIEFTYIGSIPDGVSFKNSKVIPPISGRKLSEELKKSHAYVTGSINEPAGMHHIEGAMCGLPLIYRNSGALPEYCNGFGVMFEGISDFKEKLRELINGYDRYFKRLEDYPYDSEKMCSEYEKMLVTLLEKDRGSMVKRRIRSLLLFIKESILYCSDVLIIFLNKIKRRINSA